MKKKEMEIQFKTIAVDFDGCLHSGQWPDIGNANCQAINELIRRQGNGDKVILWSCRTGDMLDKAVMWCLNHGLRFDAVNENLPHFIEKYGNNCRKVFADEYWDDKSVPVIAGQTQVKQGPGGWIFVMNEPPKKKAAIIRFWNRMLGRKGCEYVRDVVRSK